MINKQDLISEPIFNEKEPRSRVILETVKNLNKKIDELETIDHPDYICYQGVERIEGEYRLLRMGPADLITVSGYLKQENPSISKIVDWTIKIGEIYRQAEENNIKWAGLTLKSLMVTPEGKIKVVDPQILAIIDQYRVDIETPVFRENYNPPEVIEENKWHTESRLYNLGVILYYFVTGRAPFAADNKTDTFDKIMTSSYIEPKFYNFKISKQFNNLIVKLLTKDREKRYREWDAVFEDLQELKENNKLLASQTEREKNKNKGSRVIKTSHLKERFHFFFRRNLKIIAFVSILFLGLGYAIFTGGAPSVVTENTPPRQVVEYFYESINSKDVVTIDETTTVDLKNMERMLSESYVMQKMQQAYGQMSKEEMEEKVLFGVQGVDIQLKTEKPPVYVINYVFFYNYKEGRKEAPMRDVMTLQKVNNTWQITEIKGDITQLINGDFNKF